MLTMSTLIQHDIYQINIIFVNIKRKFKDLSSMIYLVKKNLRDSFIIFHNYEGYIF